MPWLQLRQLERGVIFPRVRQLGGVLETGRGLPVIIEDDVLVAELGRLRRHDRKAARRIGHGTILNRSRRFMIWFAERSTRRRKRNL